MFKTSFVIAYFLICFFLLDSAYATSYDINIPSGAASPDASFFWQNEKTGMATGNITISVGDTIIWKNADTTIHTITSGTPEDGPDGIFGGTDFISPGDFYQFRFLEKGAYPYYCIIHPWMLGIVTVTAEGYKIVPNIGKEIEGNQTFNVDYQYSGLISGTSVNQAEKSITFFISSNPKSIDQTMLMRIPTQLIKGPYSVFIDGTKNLRFDYGPGGPVNTIKIELPENVKQMTVVGTKVMPEFGYLPLLVLGSSLTVLIVFQRSKHIFKR